MNQLPAKSRLTGDPQALPAAELRGRRLTLARAAWVILAVVILGLDLAAIPYAYARYASICTRGAEDCLEEDLLTPEGARQLNDFGFSVEFYAAYNGVGLLTAATLVFVAVAAAIYVRRPQNPMALFGSFTLLVFGGAAFSGTMHELAVAHPGFQLPVNLLDYAGQVAFGVFLYLFPDGRFVPRWTRWLAAMMALLWAVNIFLPDSGLDLLNGPILVVLIASLLFAQIYRFRHASSPAQRQQTKWVLFGFVVALVGFSAMFVLVLIVPEVWESGPLGQMIIRTVMYGFILFIPLSIGVAILRYRLWDVDIIINRTLVYVALTACVVAIYVLIVGWLGAVFQARGSLAVSLLATGVVAVLFQPLRERFQRGVNHLMYGERDDPYIVLSRLGRRLEQSLASDAVLITVVQTVREALRLPYAAISLKQDGEATVIAESGTPAGTLQRVPLTYQGETLGELLLGLRPGEDAFGGADMRLLNDLARQAGVAAHGVRLTADLQRSRERLVTAREEERRRLRRDLHDGLGPQLASQTLTIDAVVKLLHDSPQVATELLQDLKAQSQAAVLDIRRLVYDLRPPALDDLGLPGALQVLADMYRHAGPRISIAIAQPLASLPAAVEVACYRIVQEALTNVVRHAGSEHCNVSIAVVDSVLELEIGDDGCGLPGDYRGGVGLHSMRERASELGGWFLIESRPDGGTCVTARIPCMVEG